jgi:DNA-binding beta-propeller fold protein YncE
MGRNVRAIVTRASAATAIALSGIVSVAPSAQAAIATYDETFGFKGPAGNYAYGGEWDPSTNTILWGDYWNYRVKRYTINGEKCTAALCDGSPFIVTKTVQGGLPGGIGGPYDIAADMSDLDGSGRASFWVADQSNQRVVQFSYTGQWLQTIGVMNAGLATGTDAAHPGHRYARGCSSGNMEIPTHVWVDPGNGRLYVSDPRCNEVNVFTHSGDFVFQFDWSGWRTATGLGAPKPRGVNGGRDFDGDGQGDVYVVEHNFRAVVVFDRSGKYLGMLDRTLEMNDPRGLAVDPTSGDVITVSAYKNKVYKFDYQTGNLIASWNTVDGVGGSTRFDSVRFAAVDGNGNIYTGDTWGARHPDPRTGATWTGHQVYKFTSNGAPLSFATGPEPPPDGGYNKSNGVAVGGGSVFVIDSFGNRGQKFDASSYCRSAANCPGWQLQFGSREPPGKNSQGFGYPHGLSLGDGYLWVGDSRAVSIWTPDGLFAHRIGVQGRTPGTFNGGVTAYAPGDGKLYTVDTGNCRLQIFDVNAALSQSTPAPLSYMGACGSGSNQMAAPRGIEARGGTVWVADVNNSRIMIWNVASKTATSVRPSCGGTTLSKPTGIAFDPTNTWLYIGDVGRKRVVRMTPDGSTCQVVTTGSDAPVPFTGPAWVDLDSSGRLYVSDASGYVSRFTVSG